MLEEVRKRIVLASCFSWPHLYHDTSLKWSRVYSLLNISRTSLSVESEVTCWFARFPWRLLWVNWWRTGASLLRWFYFGIVVSASSGSVRTLCRDLFVFWRSIHPSGEVYAFSCSSVSNGARWWSRSLIPSSRAHLHCPRAGRNESLWDCPA